MLYSFMLKEYCPPLFSVIDPAKQVHIYSLLSFYDTVSSPVCIPSNEMMNEVQRIWKEAVVVDFRLEELIKTTIYLKNNKSL
jgi:hypothetical protein